MTSEIIPLNITQIPNADGNGISNLKIKIHNKVDTGVSAGLSKNQIWEPDETALILNSLKDQYTVLDIGANIGYFSVLAADLVGAKGKVFAFEPEPSNFSLLSHNVALNQLKNVECCEFALSNQDSTGFLYLNDENLGDHRIFPDKTLDDKKTIQIKSGTDYLKDKADQIDFIKIDTQGAEFHVIKGLEHYLQNSPTHFLMLLEFWPNGLNNSGSSGNELLDLLLSYGFQLFILADQKLIPTAEEDLRKWIFVTEMDKSSDGFLNLVAAKPEAIPKTGWHSLPIAYEDPLEHLLGGALEIWNGKPVRAYDAGEFIYLKRGWGFPNNWGIWIDEYSAELSFKPIRFKDDVEAIKLRITGRYEKKIIATVQVSISGRYMGDFILSDCSIVVPIELLQDEFCTVSFKVNIPLEDQDIPPKRSHAKFGLKTIEWQEL